MSDHRFIFDAPDRYAEARAEQAAIIFDDRVITYSELQLRANCVAGSLSALGLQARSRVAILTSNNGHFFEIWLGSALGRFVLAPINVRLAPPEVAYIVNDSLANVLIVDAPFQGLVESITSELKHVREIISLGDHANWPSYSAWRDTHSRNRQQQPANPEETMMQMYTSGTTGFPKGVELNHSSMLACVRSMMGQDAWQPGEVTLVTAPLFHTAGCAWASCALQSGGTIVLLNEMTPAAILTAIEKHAVTQALLVPAVIQMVLQSEQCSKTDFSSLKRILYGGSPIPVPVLRQAVKTFRCDFEQGYGLTETVGPVAMLRPEDHLDDSKMQSCGKAVPGMEIRVVNGEGQDCVTGDVGEIIVSGAQLMNGYWQRPDETKEAICDGWLCTGDAGYFDSDGYLYIYDRLKEMIVSGAENVYPAEVERVLSEFPGIAEVAVIGVPDPKWGEAVKAVIVQAPGTTLVEQDIIDYAGGHIARFKCPKSVDFVDSLPRNPAGKIMKKVLRAPYWEGHARSIS